MKDTGYELRLGNPEGLEYSFSTSDGVESKNDFRDLELLIADRVKVSDEDILVAEANYGVIGVLLGDKNSGDTVLAETSNRAAQLCQINLEKNSVEASVLEKAFYSEIDREFDKAVYAPKSYEPVQLVKHRIAELVKLLKPEGELFIAGQKKEGIKRYSGFLKNLDGELKKIKQRGSTRLYRYRNASKPEIPEVEIENSFESEIEGEKVEFTTCEGLFSYNSLDNASRLLIENVGINSDDEALDLCCGYGAIGIWLNKLHSCNVSFSDDSRLATYYTEKNLDEQGLNASITARDCLDRIEDEFDVIVTNPPTHQGSGITDEIFQESFNHLRECGKLYAVYNQNMNFEGKLSDIFGDTKIVAEKGNFKLIKASK